MTYQHPCSGDLLTYDAVGFWTTGAELSIVSRTLVSQNAVIFLEIQIVPQNYELGSRKVNGNKQILSVLLLTYVDLTQ
jgi:hypothetical protein